MDELRVVIAIITFCISAYLGYDLFANGFSWPVLFLCCIGFLSVHYIWPRNSSNDSNWYDVLEIVIDLPYRAIAMTLRAIGRGLRSGDGDIGIDL